MQPSTPRRAWIGRHQAIALVAILLLALTRPATAVSLYDVIQLSKSGFTDEDVIEVIRATGSRFQLDADSIVTLKKEGVSEDVIQAMLKAGSRVRADRDPEYSNAANRSNNEDSSWRTRADDRPSEVAAREQTIPPARDEHSARSPQALAADASSDRAGPFSSAPFAETQTPGRHSQPHEHIMVTLHDLPLMVVRDEADYASVAARADAIAKTLNGIAIDETGRFRTTREAGQWRIVYERGQARTNVIRITQGDTIAYQRRSVGSVSAGRLSEYWAALLNDYTRAFLLRAQPAQIAALHIGSSIQALYEASATESGTLAKALDHLSSEDKDHLVELAMRVPAEFRETKEGRP